MFNLDSGKLGLHPHADIRWEISHSETGFFVIGEKLLAYGGLGLLVLGGIAVTLMAILRDRDR